MRTISLVGLSARNFMKIKEFTIDFKGNSIDVFGDNGTGKTTLKSLFNWVLFGKNAEGNSDNNFSIRPLTESGKMVRKVDIEGEVRLLIGGETGSQNVSLKRVQRENWQRKRGSIELEFVGNNTEYYIDNVPKTKREYDNYIKEICDTEIFKLITDVEYFGNLHWEKQREIISKMLECNEEDILLTDPDKFKPLLAYKKPIKEIMQVLKAEQNRINKDLGTLPIRIDERYKTLIHTDYEQTEKLIQTLESTNEKVF